MIMVDIISNFWLWIKGLFLKGEENMNIDRVFREFKREIDNKKEGELIVIGKNMKENPILWLGMFKKIILNHVNFVKQIEHFLKDEDIEISKEELNKAGEFVIFNRAWFYISNIDVNKKIDRDAVRLMAEDELLLATKSTIKFFEFLEDYEKCSFVKRIQDEIELSLAKDVPPQGSFRIL